MMDDILAYGRTQEEHDCRLIAVLSALKKPKLSSIRTSVTFLQTVLGFWANWLICLDPHKVEAVQLMSTPTSPSEVRRFL